MEDNAAEESAFLVVGNPPGHIYVLKFGGSIDTQLINPRACLVSGKQ